MLKSDIANIYRSSWAFALACPLLFAIPVLVEMAQHVVELQAGMYAGKEGAIAAEGDPLRMQFGFAKTLALLLPGYWFTRYIMFDRDGARAARIEKPGFFLWLVIFALMSLQMWFGLFGTPLAEMLGLGETQSQFFGVAKALLEVVISIYLVAWFTAWPVGNGRIGPLRSFAIMHGSFWYSLALFVVGFLPLMLVHYGLAIAAVLWLPAALDWMAMILDSVIVGFLALTMVGATTCAARRAAGSKGISLLPQRDAAHPAPA